MIKVIEGKRYNTDTATCIANDEFADGNNRQNCGRNTSLYRTKRGGYFVVHETCWQGEQTTLTPLSLSEAQHDYEHLRNEEVEFKDAFPTVEVEDA